MSAAGSQPIDLASLDQPRPFTLIPGIFEANLTALAEFAPAIVAQLQGAVLPSHWRPTLGLDDAPTFRVESPGESAAWLGGTAIPRTRAEALLLPQKLAGVNVLLPGAGTGAELVWLLDSLSIQQAVFVAETEPLRIAAILRLYDVSGAIKTGRVYFLPGEATGARLSEWLETSPGLNAPAIIIKLPDVAGDRVDFIRRECETAGRESATARTARIRELTTSIAEAPAGTANSLATVAIGANPRAWRAARQIAAAASEMGWIGEVFCADSPTRIHPLARCERLNRLRPSVVIRCDDGTDSIVVPQGVRLLQLAMTASDAVLKSPAELVLALSPRIASRLRASDESSDRLQDFPWACRHRTSETHSRPNVDLAILGDWTSILPQAVGLEHTTHLMLWNRLRELAGDLDRSDLARPESILIAAERSVGFELPSDGLRSRFLQLIERVLTPVCVLRGILDACRRVGLGVITVGEGRPPEFDGSSYSAVDTVEAAAIHPRLALASVLPDGLSHEMMEAAAAGWPLACYLPPGQRPVDWFGSVLEPARHVRLFSGAAELRRLLDSLRSEPESHQTQAAGAREHVRSKHAWHQRLRGVLESGQ